MPLPASGIAVAAARWLELLRASDVAQAWAVIRHDPALGDLTITQYASGLDWLRGLGLLIRGSDGAELLQSGRILASNDLIGLAFARALEQAVPPWLPDADEIESEEELPLDAVELASALGLDERNALTCVRHAQGKVELEIRKETGQAGELALVSLLESQWPGCVSHVAAQDDGLGYDVVLALPAKTWHLEVKSTTRRGRLVIHLSRNEYETSLTDECWQLVVVGLAEDRSASCVATGDRDYVWRAAPRDIDAGRWESARFDLGPEQLVPGLAFLPAVLRDGVDRRLRHGASDDSNTFAWLPSRDRPRAGRLA